MINYNDDRRWNHNMQHFRFLGCSGGSSAAKIASSNTFFKPFCNRKKSNEKSENKKNGILKQFFKANFFWDFFFVILKQFWSNFSSLRIWSNFLEFFLVIFQSRFFGRFIFDDFKAILKQFFQASFFGGFLRRNF